MSHCSEAAQTLGVLILHRTLTAQDIGGRQRASARAASCIVIIQFIQPLTAPTPCFKPTNIYQLYGNTSRDPPSSMLESSLGNVGADAWPVSHLPSSSTAMSLVKRLASAYLIAITRQQVIRAFAPTWRRVHRNRSECGPRDGQGPVERLKPSTPLRAIRSFTLLLIYERIVLY